MSTNALSGRRETPRRRPTVFVRAAGMPESWTDDGSSRSPASAPPRWRLSPGGSRRWPEPFDKKDLAGHFVPADKKLKPEWVDGAHRQGRADRSIAARDLERIAMPIGGICTGQLYLAGDGRLMHWDIFNQHIFSGYGSDNYRTDRKPDAALEQGFAVRIVDGDTTFVRLAGRPRIPRRRVLRRVSDRHRGLRGCDAAGGGHVGGVFAVHPAGGRRVGPAGHGDAVHGQEHVQPAGRGDARRVARKRRLADQRRRDCRAFATIACGSRTLWQ